MQNKKLWRTIKLWHFIVIILILSSLLGACGNKKSTPEPTATFTATPARKMETEEAPPTPVSTPTQSPPETQAISKTLVICQGHEPESLYLYGGTPLGTSHIHEAIYDGPYDTRTYDYQGVIYNLPSFENGKAVINVVTVQTGDRVVNDAGKPVELAEGALVRPAGCHAPECAVTFDGTPLEMDQMVASFKIKEGVTWSDGEPLTADDSVYGFELRSDPDTPVNRFVIARTRSYEAVDNLTTVWTGLPGYTDKEYFLNFFHPFPRHLWQIDLGYRAADLLEADESTRMPIGWGPFRIQSWAPGKHIILKRNPYYFRTDEGLPYVDTLVFRFINDANIALAQLIAGECDIVTQDTGIDAQAELLLELGQEDIVNPVLSPNALWEHVNFGINPVAGYERPDFFEDVRMRRAIAYCLNRQSVVDTVLYGQSIVLDSYIPPTHPLYAEDRLTTYRYDPAKGIALLEEMGWVDTDEDGIREAQGVESGTIEDGTRLAFKWQTLNADPALQYLPLFQENLAACGIEVDPEYLPAGERFFEGPEDPLFGRSFDLASFAWLTGILPPCNLYLSSEIPGEANEWVGHNAPGFINEEFDAACKRALAALPGTEEYVEAHREAQRIFSEQLPALPLFLHLNIAVIRNEVTGFIMDPTQYSEIWNVEAFDLETP